MPPLKVFFLLMFVECFFIAYVGTRLFQIKSTSKQLVFIAFINSIFTFVMRFDGVLGYIIKFGIHTLVLIAITTITTGLVLKVPFRTTFVAAAIPIVLIILGDSILLVPAMKHLGMITVMDFPKHPWKWILYGWIADGFLITTAVYIWITGFVLFPTKSKISKIIVE